MNSTSKRAVCGDFWCLEGSTVNPDLNAPIGAAIQDLSTEFLLTLKATMAVGEALPTALKLVRDWGTIALSVRGNMKVDPADHYFNGVRRPHIQVNVWLKGVKHSATQCRIPIPDSWYEWWKK